MSQKKSKNELDKLKYLRRELEKGEVGKAISLDSYKSSFIGKRERYLTKYFS